MQEFAKIWEDENLIKVLRENGVVVMPTDTLYGIVGRAESQETVEKIYKIRHRAPAKPCIILVGDVKDLEKFSVSLSEEQKNVIKNYWPFDPSQDLRPVSIVLDCADDSLEYLHRGTKTLAFRLPANIELQNLLKKVGPIIAPSANPEGLSTAKNIIEAKNYFGDLVDLYIDGGEIEGRPSKIIKLNTDGSVLVIRE